MAKKSLEEQIKLVGFWTFAGIFWYLVISFFLLSDYPIQEQPFNHKEAYNAIKDALSIAAAFLAPVAAFVLVSDWREEHIKKENEKLAIDIYDSVERGLLNLKMIHIAININDSYNTGAESSIDKKFNDNEKHLLELKLLLNRSNTKRSELKEILALAETIFIEMRQLHTDFHILHDYFMRLHFPEKEEYKKFYFNNESKAEFVSRVDLEIDEQFETIDVNSIDHLQERLKKMKILSDNLRI